MDINTLIAARVAALRAERNLSLDALARLSGVSKSNISLIERGESSPTATVLDKLAAALGVTLASLFEAVQPEQQPSPVSRRAEQPVWTDPASGYVRRNVTPPAQSPIQLVDVVFPPGQRVAYDSTDHNADIHQQIWLLDGAMEVSVGQDHWRLEAGDCLAMRLDGPIVYHNPGQQPARYAVALVTLPYTPRRPR